MLHLRQHIAALLLQLWQLALLKRQIFLALRNTFTQLSQGLLLELILSMIRYRQRLALLRQTITPPGDDLQGPLGVAAMRKLNLKLLIRLGQPRTLLVNLFLSACISVLGHWQTFLLRRQTHFALLDTIVDQIQQLDPTSVIFIEPLDLPLPVHLIISQLRQARCKFVLRFTTVANLRFQASHLGVGRKQGTLRRMHTVAGGKMTFPRFFQPPFGFAQSGALRLQIDAGTLDLARQTLAFGLRIVASQQPQQLLLARQRIAVFTVLAGDRRLPFQTLHLRGKLQPNILDAHEVVARIGNAVLGLLAPLFIFGNACRFFQKNPQLIRPRLDNA